MDEKTDVVLRNEMEAAEGSFVASVRFQLLWDQEKFLQLCRAMHSAAKANLGRRNLPRDLSQLFWYCGTFLPMWFDQRDFRVGQSHINYDQVIKILKNLGHEWFGDDCLIDDTDFEHQLAAIQFAS